MVDRQDDATLEAFFDLCPEMLFIADARGRFAQVSAALRRWFGADEDPAFSLAARVHPDDVEAFEAALGRLREGSDGVEVEMRCRDAGGAYRPVSFRAARARGSERLHGSLRDLPARAEAPSGAIEETLRNKALILDTLSESLPIGMWAIDGEGTFLYQGGRASDKVGLRPDHNVGQNAFVLYAGSEGTEVFLRRALAGEGAHFSEEALGVHWEQWVLPVRGEGGQSPRVVGFALDISRSQRIEAELRERLARIDQQQEIIRQLSTPIIEVWDGVLTLPMFGILDSMRTAEVMDSLLDRIIGSRARFAILDMTGVEVVDTGVAGYLIQLVGAIRLLGAEGIVSGIRPSVAQTMITLGADLSQITTHRNLRAALASCIRAMGKSKG
ncbi:PAS domain S-box protein [Chondromyces apiculatus]|uniref:RsbR, positive regulator of sigma-B n=1 Tax=Chondromyces apiculatus DSM 436 TaxID=1192034 RepID=A0A017TBH5_9BACT|nr:PAS domain S-box protein [Chondromyces apiculatus]EYF06175.1 RsbR, positive regulator of sigma-B [Chondromyces apiculatus DSM 436]